MSSNRRSSRTSLKPVDTTEALQHQMDKRAATNAKAAATRARNKAKKAEEAADATAVVANAPAGSSGESTASLCYNMGSSTVLYRFPSCAGSKASGKYECRYVRIIQFGFSFLSSSRIQSGARRPRGSESCQTPRPRQIPANVFSRASRVRCSIIMLVDCSSLFYTDTVGNAGDGFTLAQGRAQPRKS